LFEGIWFRSDPARLFTTKTVGFIRIKPTVPEGMGFAAVIYKPEKPLPSNHKFGMIRFFMVLFI
jgi:hypothetical protein